MNHSPYRFRFTCDFVCPSVLSVSESQECHYEHVPTRLCANTLIYFNTSHSREIMHLSVRIQLTPYLYDCIFFSNWSNNYLLFVLIYRKVKTWPRNSWRMRLKKLSKHMLMMRVLIILKTFLIFFLGSLIVIEGKDFLYMGWVLFEEHKTSYVMLVFFFVNWLLIYAIFSLPFI